MKSIGTLCFIAGFMCISMGVSILLNTFYYSVPAEGIFVRAVKHKGTRAKYEKYRNRRRMDAETARRFLGHLLK